MERMDNGMPFLLKYENVAWYDSGKVRILDRRVFPERCFVECETYQEVRQAVADMVTQSTGPYAAVAMGMVLAARQSSGLGTGGREANLKKAADELAHARPTTSNRYALITNKCANAGIAALESGQDPEQAIFDCAVGSMNERYARMQLVGDELLKLIPEGGAILTQCYGETIIGTLIRAALRENRHFRVYCAETRPYMQGARLTSACFAEMGFDTTVATDNMIAYAMQHEGIDLFTSAADCITLDGHVANKVGTLQIAILAKYFGLPYYVTGAPDAGKHSAEDIVIEMRDPSQVLNYRGIRTTVNDVKAIYPAFDITPPHLISGVVTDKGVYVPYLLDGYFDGEHGRDSFLV